MSVICSTAKGSETPTSDYSQARAWVEHVKTLRLGPFESVRWFCADGSVLPPEPYACRNHGGGRQHGLRSDQAQALRDQGVLIANVLAELDPADVLSEHARVLKALLIEQHLVALDDGWIFRQTRFARGAFQIEDETAAADKILKAMSADPRYAEDDFLLFREAVRRLPNSGEGSRLDAVRMLASSIALQDPDFVPLRNKIHSRPDQSDIAAVRTYQTGVSNTSLQAEYQRLADDLKNIYQQQPLGQVALDFGQRSGDPAFAGFAKRWNAATTASDQLDIAASILALIRMRISLYRPADREAAMRLSLVAEDTAFTVSREVVLEMADLSRMERLDRLRILSRAIFGTGLLTERENTAIREQVSNLALSPRISLHTYRHALDVFARVPLWAANRLNYTFAESIRAFTRIEPMTNQLIPDRLRAGPALSYGEILESLSADADHLAGIRQEVFGRQVSGGLRGLNPGLARGPLARLSDPIVHGPRRAIVLAPESAADLPAVAGILTATEGNALSHVQLLARNLGVPNVVVRSELIPVIESHVGSDVVLAVSPAGVVRIHADGPQWDGIFPKQDERAAVIRPDLERLNLQQREFLSLTTLRADDSGRTVGPKAAKLGELKSRYPEHVSDGLTIPFGRFREALDSRMANGSSVFTWMQQNYRTLAKMAEGPARQAATQKFLTELRAWLENYSFTPDFLQELKSKLEQTLGPNGSYGVFVRSDTNVEDLPGFTGAGLNLTVPNVVGFEQILDAIRRVWASPFSERAFGWRQALMDQPEHVYVAVLLHKTVPGTKSGVMITSDLATGSRDWITLATNEGVGGGVEGQAAETLRVSMVDGAVELLTSATEPLQRRVLQIGGTDLVRAFAPEYLLSQSDIDQLLMIARSLPSKYPDLLDAQGRIAPADVEFALTGGRLYLNQIRPFLQSERARRNEYLLSLDDQLKASADRLVDLNAR